MFAHPQLHCGSGDVRDDDPPAPVEDRPAWRLDADQAELVRLGRVQVLVARQHLQRPEPEEEDDEDDESERAEDRDAQRELRREPVRLAHPRIRRQEAAARAHAAPGTARTSSLDEDLDLGRRLGAQLLAHDRADEPVDGQREDEVQDEGAERAPSQSACLASTSSSRR